MSIQISEELKKAGHPLVDDYLKDGDTNKLFEGLKNRNDIGFREGVLKILAEQDWKSIYIERTNTHDCLDCTLKHLSSAIVEMGELQKGWWGTDHEIFCMGNLAEASEQIAGYSLDIANKLRELRRDIFEVQEKILSSHIQDCKDLFWAVKKIKDPNFKQNITTAPSKLSINSTTSPSPVKRCGGCGAKKGLSKNSSTTPR